MYSTQFILLLFNTGFIRLMSVLSNTFHHLVRKLSEREMQVLIALTKIGLNATYEMAQKVQ